MTDDLTRSLDHEVAIAAAQAGADVLRSMFGTDLSRVAKSALDSATTADLASEEAILRVVRAARPDDGFVGEEVGEVVGAHVSRRWLVDPLCGTLNFAAATATYSVNVALVEAGTTVAAAVAHPPSGEVYWASEDDFGILGRTASPPHEVSTLVAVNADGPLDRPFVGAQLAADREFRRQFSPRVESTTLALAWVASGQRLAYVTDGLHRDSVHFTAGIALCLAAGCVVTDFDGREVHTGPGLVAASDAAAHRALLALVARHRAG